jgi:hypothetical protein
MWERNIITSSEIIGEGTVNLFDWLMLAYRRKGEPVFPFQEKHAAEKKASRLALMEAAGVAGDAIQDDDDPENQPSDSDEDSYEDSEDDDDEIEPEEEDADDNAGEPLLKTGEQPSIPPGGTKEIAKATPVDDVEGEDDEDAPKKTDEDADPDEESETTKLLNQIYQFVGYGDHIAEDAEWIPMTRHDKKRNKLLNRGRLAVSISIVDKDEMESQPVGDGRSEPNQNPYLPPPVGRISFSFNPFVLLAQLCGWRTICCLICICCCICCVATFAFLSNYISGFYSLYEMFHSKK